MKIDVEENFLDSNQRNSSVIEDEIKDFLDDNEAKNIKADIELLNSMGFEKKMINKVYILLRPENIERAIDYMTEIDGVYQHDFIPSGNPNEKSLCFICKKLRKNHQDYIPDDLLIDAQINNIPIHNPQIIEENLIKDEKKSNKKENDNLLDDECEVCYEEINIEEKKLNEMPCGHLFCTHCWFNYLKTSILEAKVDKLKCMEHECKEIVSEEFILKHISENNDLVEKYYRFKKRAEILKDKNKKICPNPDCDSFLQKSNESKYVQCENGHKYCYECLKPPHGNTSCDQKLEKQFMKWKKGKRVKRCPRCQMYTEKNEGCNHMTCISCKYQWCWLCEGEYRYGHYDSGKCKGQQFTRADNLRCICLRNFGLHKIFSCVFPDINEPFNDLDDILWVKYLLMLGFWIFGFAAMIVFVIFDYMEFNVHIYDDCLDGFVLTIAGLICLALFVAFEISFTSLITPFILISFIYHPFFQRLLFFFGLGD